ncbi:MAG: hypothetical protein JXR91_17300, partial [Deltaproteobacteria bacterium]|nr:hypothetical protein [Deltaproteobacteria bacterium]
MFKQLLSIIVMVFSVIFLTDCSSSGSSRGTAGGDSDTNLQNGSDSENSSDSDYNPVDSSDSSFDSSGDSSGGTDTNETVYIPDNSENNTFRQDYLYCEYKTIEETDTTFKGELTIGNANDDYVWNGYSFTVWSVDLKTTSEITLVGLDEWNIVKYSQDGDKLTIDLGDDKYFPDEFLNTKAAAANQPFATKSLVTLVVEGNKNGQYPYPVRCQPNYIRGDIIYPVYEDLPHSWWKGRTDLTAADLIADENDYYKEEVSPRDEGVFIYHPKHNTQINIGQPHGVGRTINGFDNLYIRVPNKMMAMGMALNYEWFKFNPNYFCALGTKENYACGFAAMDDPQAGSGGTTVNIQGVDYHWYIVLPSTDGPFQQEEPNFIGVARIFPDYFSSENDYEKYVYVSDAPNDPQWASAVINSALSNVATRETLWAFQRGEYGRIVFDAKDPMAELGVITFTYNRGIGAFCGTGVMGNLDAFVASDDTISDFGLIGFAEHVPSIKAIT